MTPVHFLARIILKMILDLQHLNVSNPQKLLIKDFNYHFEKPKKYFFFGKSGIGKSLLLDTIAGLNQNYTGSYTWDRELASHRAYLFQNNALIPWLTINENLRLPRKVDTDRAKQLMTLLAIDSLAEQLASVLSGGEIQMINFVRALSVGPKVILADEPFASLDYKHRQLMTQTLVDYCNKESASVFWVSHDLQEVCEYADEVLCFDGQTGHYTMSLRGSDINPTNLYSFITYEKSKQ